MLPGGFGTPWVGGPVPKGPFRTKNSTAPKAVVFCYRRSFLLSVPFSCLFFLEKQALLSTLRSVLLLPYRIFLAVVNLLSVVFLVRKGPLGRGFRKYLTHNSWRVLRYSRSGSRNSESDSRNPPMSSSLPQRAQRSKHLISIEIFDLDRNFWSRSKILISMSRFPQKNRAAVGGSLENFTLDRNFQSRSKSRIFLIFGPSGSLVCTVCNEMISSLNRIRYFTRPPETICGFFLLICLGILHWEMAGIFGEFLLVSISHETKTSGKIRSKIRGKIRDENSKNSGNFRSATFLT